MHVKPEEMIIRNATQQDLPGILEIYNDAILHTTAVYQYAPHTLEMRQAWFSEKQACNFPVIVAALNDGAIAGFSTFGPFRAWTAYKYSAESSVYIHPAHRGKGIGKALMAPLIAAASHRQLHTLVAGIDATNLASIRLHAQFGFIETAVMKQVGYKFGKWLDLLFMQLILETPRHPEEG